MVTVSQWGIGTKQMDPSTLQTVFGLPLLLKDLFEGEWCERMAETAVEFRLELDPATKDISSRTA